MTKKNTACELREELQHFQFMLNTPLLRSIITKTMLHSLRKQFTDVETRSAVVGITFALELVLIHLEELLGEAKEESDTFDDEDQDEDIDELLTSLLKTLL